MVMGINFPDLTMVPGSVEPMVRQSYKDRIDESLGMRRGPERDFKQTLADRRDESMGASLGRYGEPGLPSLVKTPSPQPMGSPSTQGAYASPESQAGYKADLLAYAAANNIRRDDSDPNQVNADALGVTLDAYNRYLADISAQGAGTYTSSDYVWQPGDYATEQGMYAGPTVTPKASLLNSGDGVLNTSFGRLPTPEAIKAAVAAAVGGAGTGGAGTAGTAGGAGAGTVGGTAGAGAGVDAGTAGLGGAGLGGAGVDAGVDAGTGTGQTSFMDQLQVMVDQILAQQAAQQTAQQTAQQQQAQAAQNYALTTPAVGYNPYTSGQYQADPYGAAGVPDMGGLTTIPVPQPLTGTAFANYQAPENMT